MRGRVGHPARPERTPGASVVTFRGRLRLAIMRPAPGRPRSVPMARVFIRNPTRYRLTIGDRGAMRLPPQAAGMTYHHIIPFNELRDFWNTAVANDLEQLRET